MPPPVPWRLLTSTRGGHDHGRLASTSSGPPAAGPWAAATFLAPPAAGAARPSRRSFVQAASTRADFAALLGRLGILGHWDELAALDVTVRVLGSVFDREGYPVGSVPPYPEEEELTVCFYREDVYLGAILLADLCRLAAVAPGTPDATPAVGR